MVMPFMVVIALMMVVFVMTMVLLVIVLVMNGMVTMLMGVPVSVLAFQKRDRVKEADPS